MNGFVHQPDDFGRFGNFGSVPVREPLFQYLAHERDSGKKLSQPVVQVLPDTALLPAAHFHDGGFQALAHRDIGAGGDEILRHAV